MAELFPEGFEEVELGADGLELAAYTRARGEERLWEAFGPGQVAEVEPGWSETWKRFHRPVRIGPLWVGPPWAPPDPGAQAVVIDPGQAFGTGGHPTTRLCLELLLALLPTAKPGGRRERSSLVDLGCGSGVVAIAAAKLGFSPVLALDLDEAAVKATSANAEANDVDVDVRISDVLNDALPFADVAVANIALDPVEKLAARLESARLVTSGYLAYERPTARTWTHVDRRESDGWAADLFERRGYEREWKVGLR